MSADFESGFAYREQAWHGGMKVTAEALTAEEVLQQAGLDWEVQLCNMTVGGIPIPNYRAVVRETDNTILGIVGSRYQVVQNAQLLGVLDPVVSRGDAVYHTAGSLRGGKIVWLLAKLPQEYWVTKDDRVDSYVLVSSTHDGSSKVIVKPTQIRVVCYNTLSVALMGPETTVSIRHTNNANYELSKAYLAIGLATRRFNHMAEVWSALANKRFKASHLSKLVDRVFPTKRKDTSKPSKHLEPIEVLLQSSPGTEGIRDTAWGAYAAITEYIDHGWMANSEPGTRTLRTLSSESIRAKALNILLKQTWEE